MLTGETVDLSGPILVTRRSWRSIEAENRKKSGAFANPPQNRCSIIYENAIVAIEK